MSSHTIRKHESLKGNPHYCDWCGMTMHNALKVDAVLCILRYYSRETVRIESLAPDTETMKNLKETREEVNRSCRQTVDGSLPGSTQYFQYVALAALIDMAASWRYLAEREEEAEKELEASRG